MNDNASIQRPHPDQVAHAFLTPRPPQRRQALALDSGEALRIPTPEGEVALQRAGTGPTVLLLHGWEGQASDFAAFAPPLFIHSTDDRVVVIEDSLASAAAWPGARHLRVEGLGHRRILGDPAVVATAIEFITTSH